MPYSIITGIETTGRRAYSQVIEAAAVALDSSFEEVDRFHVIANPGEEALRSLDPEALRVNGMSLEEIRAGTPIEEAARQYREFIDRYPHAPIHAFNGFGIRFLSRPPWAMPTNRAGEAVMLAAMDMMIEEGVIGFFENGKPKCPPLKVVASFFGVPYEPGAGRMPDTRAVAAVYAAVLKRRGSPDYAAMDEVRLMMEDIF